MALGVGHWKLRTFPVVAMSSRRWHMCEPEVGPGHPSLEKGCPEVPHEAETPALKCLLLPGNDCSRAHYSCCVNLLPIDAPRSAPIETKASESA